jgi:50S ribosomal protein L16 3-hydroxylase
MGLQQWLDELTVSQFVSDFYHKLPHSGTCFDRGDCELGQWEVVEKIVAANEADVMVVREGRRFEGDVSIDAGRLRQLVKEGFTILVRHAESHHPGLKQLAEDFRSNFHAPVNIHMYATPGGKFGFDWHYDAEDVFILQATGEKEYSLRKNTVNPWPLVENMPVDLRYERELMPLMRCLLKAGDWLYIPNGYWHKADAVGDEIAISLAVGVMAPSALTIWDHLRTELAESLLWRQRLPTLGDSRGLDENARQGLTTLMKQLAEDIERRLTDEQFVDSLIAQLKDSE